MKVVGLVIALSGIGHPRLLNKNSWPGCPNPKKSMNLGFPSKLSTLRSIRRLFWYANSFVVFKPLWGNRILLNSKSLWCIFVDSECLCGLLAFPAFYLLQNERHIPKKIDWRSSDHAHLSKAHPFGAHSRCTGGCVCVCASRGVVFGNSVSAGVHQDWCRFHGIHNGCTVIYFEHVYICMCIYLYIHIFLYFHIYIYTCLSS